MKFFKEIKLSKIFWGLGFILVAIFLLLNALGVMTPILNVIGGVTLLQIILGLFLVSFIISRIVRLRFASLLIPLSLLFMVFEKNVAFVLGMEDENIINNWLLFGCALLLTAGISILTPKSVKYSKKFKSCKGGTKHNQFGSHAMYVDCSDFVERMIYNYLGEYSVHFENTDQFTSGATINVYNKLGEVVIYVPREWTVKESIDNNLGDVSYSGSGSENGPVLVLSGSNELGEISIKFI
ncbi:MAG: hypothetical protein J6M35_05060 [Clostridia bacterium]|nr:hypothetical protein [Clostridia bacterium]